MTDHIADLHFNGDTQCFPRWLPGEQSKAAEDTLDFGEPSEMPSGFSQEALPHFQAAYPGKPITEDDLFYYPGYFMRLGRGFNRASLRMNRH